MTDIIMCSSDNCPMKSKCYRSNGTKGLEYFNFEYTCNENSGFCDFILMIKSEAKNKS